jgi:hypothetical protein
MLTRERPAVHPELPGSVRVGRDGRQGSPGPEGDMMRFPHMLYRTMVSGLAI